MPDVLVLDHHYQAISLATAQRALEMLFAGRAERVWGIDDYDAYFRSPSISVAIPQVIRARGTVPRRARTVALTRKNLLLRDDFTCQYCGLVDTRTTHRTTRHKGKMFVAGGLTIDHVQPRSRGGENTFTNCVSACFRCNNSKAARTPSEAGMTLRRRPYQPSWIQFLIKRRGVHVPPSWEMFLFQGSAQMEQIA